MRVGIRMGQPSEVFKKLSSKVDDDVSSVVLRHLLAEPSGEIEEIMRGLRGNSTDCNADVGSRPKSPKPCGSDINDASAPLFACSAAIW